MKVVLRSDVSGLGKRGDLVQVADGYGRNYLLPQGHAIPATPGIMAQATAMRKARDIKDHRAKEAAEEIAVRLVGMTFEIAAKVGKDSKLFGSIGVHDVIDKVKEASGIELDRKRVHMHDPIKSSGDHQIPVKLHDEVEIQLNVKVVSDSE
ncbi:MAG: 50S ribosomal protein L9 [Acidimicrobiales bacterium]|jgi:large subunit ribosomal protein L9